MLYSRNIFYFMTILKYYMKNISNMTLLRIKLHIVPKSFSELTYKKYFGVFAWPLRQAVIWTHILHTALDRYLVRSSNNWQDMLIILSCISIDFAHILYEGNPHKTDTQDHWLYLLGEFYLWMYTRKHWQHCRIN
jgi:hypothetical protein